MNERPILFNGDMVRAILDGRKTQTRRAFNDKQIKLFAASAKLGEVSPFLASGKLEEHDLSYIKPFCKFGGAGDRLWVREAWRKYSNTDECGCYEYPCGCPEDGTILYRASHDCGESKWKPSIHMPRTASRITLEIENVRVERLQDISEEDAIAEGIENNCSHIKKCDCYPGEWINYLDDNEGFPCYSPTDSFRTLWQKINGADSWAGNPWVWVIDFRRVE